MDNEFKNIEVELADNTGRLILDRPPLNILNIEMMREINAALERFCRASALKVVIITGRGKAFSAGVDIKDHTADKVKEMIAVFHKIFDTLKRISAPTLALVNGAALGGGCELAAFCDLVVASERAKFGQPEIKVGVFPPIAALIFPKLMLHKKALELLLSGDVITAEQAKELGLVNEIISSENFDADANNFVEKITSNSSVVLQLTKRAVYDTLTLDYADALKKIENIYLDELMRTEDANEGLKAFLEKRRPVWKNK